MTHAEAMTIASFLRNGRHYRSRHHARGLSELWFDQQQVLFILTASRQDPHTSSPLVTRHVFSHPSLCDWLMRTHVYKTFIMQLYVPEPSQGRERWPCTNG
jgi:hypothetical protein